MTTQDDIARKLNISRTTVSRALQGKNVSEETRKKVLALAGELDYSRNLVATGLATKAVKKVYAFIVATIDEGYALQMIEGINEVADIWREYNFEIDIILTDISIGFYQDQEQLKQFYDVMEKNDASGIIFSALSSNNEKIVEEECTKRKISLMTIDMIYRSDLLCHVGPDYFELGTYSAAFISQLLGGKGKILTISYDEGYLIGKERMRGFFSKIASKENFEVVNYDIHEMHKQLYWDILDKNLTKENPQAIYAPYHVEYIAEYLEKNKVPVDRYVLIANGVNANIESYLYSGMINGIVSAKPYLLGAVVANNFFKYFYRRSEMKKGNIDVGVDIFIAENYQRHNLLF